MRIWHWQALKNVRLNQQKRNPPYYCDNCFTTLLGLILATNSLFNTSPSSLDLVVDIAYWSKILVHLESLQLVFEIAYSSKILVDLDSRPLKCSTWYPTRLAWPSPSGGDQDTSAWKNARIVNLVICYSPLIWPGWRSSHFTCCAFKSKSTPLPNQCQV